MAFKWPLITVGCFFSNLSYQSLSFKIEFGAFVMVFTIAQGPRQLMPLFFGIKLVFKDLLNIQTRIFKQRYTIFLIWLRNEWTSGRAWVWWYEVCWNSSFLSGFGITISKILDYWVDGPSRLEFKFFLWFWKKYFKNLRLSSWPTK